MSESKSHRNLKNRLAGPKGTTEKKISRGRRLDARTARKAFEIERSGTSAGISKAISRLNSQKTAKKELRVPNAHLNLAVKTAKSKGTNVTIKNLSGTKRRTICGK